MPKKNWLEWGVFAVSFLLVAGVLGYLIYEIAAGGEARAQLVVTLGEPLEGEEGYVVPITAKNNGDQTAEEAEVIVTLTIDGEEQEATFTIPFLPGHATREGWVIFTENPAEGELEARVAGYHEP